jgi:hypothetical protein
MINCRNRPTSSMFLTSLLVITPCDVCYRYIACSLSMAYS